MTEPIVGKSGEDDKTKRVDEGVKPLEDLRVEKMDGVALAAEIKARLDSMTLTTESQVADVLKADFPDREEAAERVTPENMAEFAAVWELYEASFVPDERRDFRAHLETLKNPNYEMHAVKLRDRVVGFIGVWNLQVEGEDWMFGEHIAVHPAYQSKGIGKVILDKIVKDKNIVGEVENPEGFPPSDPRCRRIRLYEKEGWHLNDQKSPEGSLLFDYIQPSYGEGRKPTPLILMTKPYVIRDKAQFEALRDQIYKIVYGLPDGKLPQKGV
ncbi:MAG: GNAT family N-acetyltransferase [Candidatus Gracilibacteria bacterium]